VDVVADAGDVVAELVDLRGEIPGQVSGMWSGSPPAFVTRSRLTYIIGDDALKARPY